MQTIYIRVSDTQLPEAVRVSIYSHMQTSATPERELAKVQRAAARRGLATVTYTLATRAEWLAAKAEQKAAIDQAQREINAR